MFGLGLMIYSRRPNQNLGYIVMCEIFISIGGSVFILLVQLAVPLCYMSLARFVTPWETPSLELSGQTRSAEPLRRSLPASALSDIITIYLPTQLSCPVGSAV